MYAYIFILGIFVNICTVIPKEVKDRNDLCPSVAYCSCSEDKFLTCPIPGSIVPSPWNLQTTFDSIGKDINDPNFVFEKLDLSGLELKQPLHFPKHFLKSIRVKEIALFSYNQFNTFDEEAFSGTSADTKVFYLTEHEKAAYDPSIFNVISKLQQLTHLSLTGVLLPSIPPSAFVTASPTLQVIEIAGAGVGKIGRQAFAGLPRLMNVYLHGNKLKQDGIDSEAFHRMTSTASLTLQSNPTLSDLAVDKFKAFLDNTRGKLHVGSTMVPADEEDLLECGPNVNWICANNYLSKIDGYDCKASKFSNLAEYCAAIKNTEQSPNMSVKLEFNLVKLFVNIVSVLLIYYAL